MRTFENTPLGGWVNREGAGEVTQPGPGPEGVGSKGAAGYSTLRRPRVRRIVSIMAEYVDILSER